MMRIRYPCCTSSNKRLVWHPDRCVIIEYKGHNMFTVVESANSKLSVGDTFICHCFIQGEPLYLSCLVHEGDMPTGYVCGQQFGVTFDKINH